MPNEDWKSWVRSQTFVERLEIRCPAGIGYETSKAVLLAGWRTLDTNYETINGVQECVFTAEREIHRPTDQACPH